MTRPDIVVEDHPTPVVAGVGATLKRSAAQPRLARALARMDGVLALRSTQDAQAVTARFKRGKVELSRGAASDADVTILLDFNNMSGPGAPKPKVSGAVRHPLFALRVARVMEPPVGRWQDEAATFWDFAKDAPRVPTSLLVVCTDDGTQVRFGDLAGEPAYEIHGTGDALKSVFSGASIFGEDLLEGRLLVVGTFEHGSVLTGRSIAWAMGEGR